LEAWGLRKQGGDQGSTRRGLSSLGDSKDQLAFTIEPLFTFTYSLFVSRLVRIENMMYFEMCSE
jgi:hypothetical protein